MSLGYLFWYIKKSDAGDSYHLIVSKNKKCLNKYAKIIKNAVSLNFLDKYQVDYTDPTNFIYVYTIKY
jgi:hypothetical protein